jgi:hypothetical protein
MITQVRAARPAIILGGKDYYSQLAPYLLNLIYQDNCDGEKADDLQFQLADRDRKFINEWMPDLGTTLDVQIIAERWFAPNASPLILDCGSFWIDEVEFDLPQHTVSVKACSLPTTAHLKVNNEARHWEQTDLLKIVTQISQENGLDAPIWESKYLPQYANVEQNNESALSFIKKRAQEAKLAIKVHRNRIVVFDEEDYEAKLQDFEVIYGQAAAAGGKSFRMEAAQFMVKNMDTQHMATVSHLNPDTGKNTQGVFTGEGTTGQTSPSRSSLLGGGQTNWKQHVPMNPEQGENGDGEGENGDGEGELVLLTEGGVSAWNDNTPGGMRKAKAVVRDANKDRVRGIIKMGLGNPLVAAGSTCNVVGCGQFDGKWFVESVQHELAEMYNTTLNVRRCLTGY